MTVANRLFVRRFVAHRSQRYGVAPSSRLAANEDPARFVSSYFRVGTLACRSEGRGKISLVSWPSPPSLFGHNAAALLPNRPTNWAKIVRDPFSRASARHQTYLRWRHVVGVSTL